MYDTILGGSSQEKEAKIFKIILRDYEKASHQRINIQKNRIFFLNTLIYKQTKIAKSFGCKIGHSQPNT